MSPSSQLLVARAKSSILVVDDDILILEIIRRILEYSGFTVVTSESCEDAWTRVEQGQVRPDLVLTDIVMPGSMDGLTLAEKIRHRNETLLVLFMTGMPEHGWQTAEMAKRGLLLQKPFSRKQLIEFIDSHYRKERPERSI
jgi:CheY-like chemotaxis protein